MRSIARRAALVKSLFRKEALNGFALRADAALHELRLAAAASRERRVQPLCQRAQIAAALSDGVFPRAARAREHRAAPAAGLRHRVAEPAHALAAHLVLEKQHIAALCVLRRDAREHALLQFCAAQLERGKLAQHPLNRRGGSRRLDRERLRGRHVLRPTGGKIAVRPPAAQQLDAHALAELLHGEKLHDADLSAPHDVRAAARAAVRAGEGHDAHVALERLFAAVVDRVQLRAAVELNVDGVILIDVPVRHRFDLQQLLPRNVGVEVDGHALRAHVEAHVVAAVARADQPRADVLAGVLLHMVEAPRPIKPPMHRLADG